MPDYVPIQDLTIAASLSDSDYIPISDGDSAYAIRAATLKAYAEDVAESVAEEAAETAVQAGLSGIENEISVRGKSVENDIGEITGNRPLIFIPGYYRTPTTTGIGETAYYVESDERVCAIAPCTGGDNVYGHVVGLAGTTRAFFFTDATLKVISRADANYELNGAVTAPAGSAYVILNNVLASLPNSYFGYVGDSIASSVEGLGLRLDALHGYPKNLFLNTSGFIAGSGYVYVEFEDGLPAGEYSCYLNVSSSNTGTEPYFRVVRTSTYSTANVILTRRVKNGAADCLYFKTSEPFKSIFIFAAETVGESQSYTVTVSGTEELYGGKYIKNDGATNVTKIIRNILEREKYCKLPYGDYLIDNLDMPDESALCGEGDTNVYFDSNATGVAVMMGSRCTVKDLTLFGATENITLPPSDFEPEMGDVDYLANVQPTIRDGWLYYVFDNELPAGTYRIRTNISSSNTDVKLYVKILDSASYGTSHVLEVARANNGTESWMTVSSEAPIKSVFVFAASSVSGSAGYTLTINEPTQAFSMTQLVGVRHGIAWQSKTDQADNMEFGRISNCRIERFSGSGVRARDTGTPVDNNLAVSDCFIRNCVVGIYVQRNSEFLKISNNTIVQNWYGILNRGGNNNIANCGIDGNVVGVQVDQDEGSNNGHGAITGCSINHSDGNTGYGLVIKDTGREIISNCNMYYSKIQLKNTDGNVISNCGFGRNAGLDIIGGLCSLIVGCMVMSYEQFPITRSGNTTARIINCYTRSGNEVTG